MEKFVRDLIGLFHPEEHKNVKFYVGLKWENGNSYTGLKITYFGSYLGHYANGLFKPSKLFKSMFPDVTLQ